MFKEFALLSLITSILNLTNMHFGFLFLGQPLVTGGIIGSIIGDLPTGLFLGAVIQFFWVRSLPIGVKVQTNYTIMTFLAVYLVHIFGTGFFPVAFLLAYLLALTAKELEVMLKKINNYFVECIIKNIQKVNLGILNIVYICLYVLVFGILTLTGLLISHQLLLGIAFYFPPLLLEAFRFVYRYMGLFALSLFYSSVSFPFKDFYLAAGIVLGVILLMSGLPEHWALFILAGTAFSMVFFLRKQTALHRGGK